MVLQRRKPCLTNLRAFYDKATNSLAKGRAGESVYLAFSKAASTVSPNILLDKLMKFRQGKWRMRWHMQ